MNANNGEGSRFRAQGKPSFVASCCRRRAFRRASRSGSVLFFSFFFTSRTGVSAVGNEFFFLGFSLHPWPEVPNPRSINRSEAPSPSNPSTNQPLPSAHAFCRECARPSMEPTERAPQPGLSGRAGTRERAGPKKSQPPTTRSRFGCRCRGR